MKSNLLYLLSFVFLFSLSSCSENRDAEFKINRGTNISHWLSQSDRRGTERKEFFTEKDVKLIDSLGFDHIRLPVDEEQLWNEDGERNEEAFGLMNNAIEWCRDAGLRVVLDLHIIRSHHFNKEEKPLWTDPAEQDKLIGLWKDLSSFLSHYPDSLLAYEIMNEAVADDPDDWNKLSARAIEELRKTEPGRKIVVGSNRWQSVHTFDVLEVPENDSNIILSFHFYHPFLLTHHEASWTFIGQYEGPVNYPGRVVRDEDLEDLSGELLEQVKSQSGVYTIDTMRAEIQKPVNFANEHNLPLYCGEFGCLPTVPEDMRLQWYRDIVTVLEENDIAWANWDYKGGFGIVQRDGTVNEELVKALME